MSSSREDSLQKAFCGVTVCADKLEAFAFKAAKIRILNQGTVV